MKPIIVAVVTVLAAAPLLRAQIPLQRLPITIKGTQISQAYGEVPVTTQLVDAGILSAPGNQLVIAVNLDQNFLAIEEWDGSLSQKADRSPLYPGTQSVVWATADYAALAKSATLGSPVINFVATLESVDDDWDDDGTSDHFGSVTLVGTLQYASSATLTSRDGSSVLTGVVTGVRATIQGPLNDITGAEDTPEIQLRKGKLRSTSSATFYVRP